MSTSAAAPSLAAPLSEIVEHALALVQFRQELDNRVATAGVAGVEDLLVLLGRLHRGLDRIAHGEIEQAEARLDDLREDFAQLGNDLRLLKTLKLSVPAAQMSI